MSDLTATRDLKAMVDKGLLEAVGERRARYYLAGAPLTQLRTGDSCCETAKERRGPVPDRP